MKFLATACIFASFLSASAVPSHAASDLGPLENYFRNDCIGARGFHRAHVHRVFEQALAGDHDATAAVLMHQGDFATGDNEAWSELPQIFLRTLGDSGYAAFVTSQRAAVRDAALLLFPAQLKDFDRTYPKTAKLYHAWVTKQRRTSNQSMQPTAGRCTTSFSVTKIHSFQITLAVTSGG